MSGALPVGACDTHCHVFGPVDRFPYARDRTYTPDDAPKEDLFALHDSLGIDCGVIVQPACHGFDHSAMLDALHAREGRYRGVALLREDATEEEIAVLHAGGVRGVRFNFLRRLSPPPTLEGFRRIAAMTAMFGWHVVLHAGPDDLDFAVACLGSLETAFVIDHMARIDAADGLDQKGFRRLLELAGDPRAWIKLSAADRASAAGAPYADAALFMRRLIEIAPDRVLWGTDWPHPNIKGPAPDKKMLLAILREVAGDDAMFRRILVENPGRLYRFESPQQEAGL